MNKILEALHAMRSALRLHYRGDNRAIRSLNRAEKNLTRTERDYKRALNSKLRENETPESRKARIEKARDAVELAKIKLEQKDEHLREVLLSYSPQIWGTADSAGGNR